MTLPSTYTKITFPSTNDSLIVPTESNNLNITNEDVPPINTKFVNMGVVNPFDNKLIQTILTVSQNVAKHTSTTQLNIHKTTGDGFNLFVGDKIILLTKEGVSYDLTITENFTNESTALKFNAVIFDTPIGDGAMITISQVDQFNEGNRKTRGQVAGFTISPSTITKNGIGISNWYNDPTFNEVDNTTLPTSQAVKEYVLSKKDIIETKLIKVNDDVINKSAFLHDDGLRFTRVSDGIETGQINYDGVDTITLNSAGGSSTGATRLDFQVNSGSKMVIDNEGDVGIGTTSPVSNLHVFEGSSGESFTNLYGLAVETSGTSNSYHAMQVATGEGTVFDITNAGNVGIGTTSPEAKLQVGDGTDDDATRVYFSDNTYAELRGYGMQFSRASSYLRPTTDNTKNLYIGNSSQQWYNLGMDASTITFNTNGSENMRIKFNGNVGIGTTSPQNKLDIVGSLGRGIPVTKTANFTVAATENWLIINGLRTITIRLPSASNFSGRELMIKNIAARTVISDATNVIRLSNNETTNGILPAIAGSWCVLVSNGLNWITMSGSAGV